MLAYYDKLFRDCAGGAKAGGAKASGAGSSGVKAGVCYAVNQELLDGFLSRVNSYLGFLGKHNTYKLCCKMLCEKRAGFFLARKTLPNLLIVQENNLYQLTPVG